jgi:catechol 2,3-dioxygenase-like lactoylglutathione lyase family enzyme
MRAAAVRKEFTRKGVVDNMPKASPEIASPSFVAAYPQLFVSDIRAACEFYTRVLGFGVVFVHGEPPFYAQVERGGARLNFRFVCEPVFGQDIRERESLLSAYIDVGGVEDLYGQFRAAGAQFQQALKRQPWGAHDFVVRDPDGNLLCFAE